MCNLYSITTNQNAIAALFRMNRYVGNLPPMPGVFPDYPAPIVRNAGSERELVLMRWGMPPPPRTGGPPVTNIRNTSSPHWRGWLKPENRCVVPFNSFAEYAPEPNPETKKKDVVWFAINDDRPLTCFAGIWTEFKGDRGTKSKPIPGPRPRDEIETDPRPASGLRLSHDVAERGRRTDPSKSHAGHPADRRGARHLDARAVG
jgi:putative SOS response-associated peptidase YedK